MTSDWLFPLPPDDAAQIGAATAAFRDLWASIRPPWPHAFDGTLADVRAIDYLHYEGITFPPCGIEGAALVCGEVLRRAAGLRWMSSYRGDWFVASDEVAVCPVVRVQEIYFTGTPQFGRFSWFLARAAVDCLPFTDGATQEAVRQLVLDDEDFVHDFKLTVARLWPAGRRT